MKSIVRRSIWKTPTATAVRAGGLTLLLRAATLTANGALAAPVNPGQAVYVRETATAWELLAQMTLEEKVSYMMHP